MNDLTVDAATLGEWLRSHRPVWLLDAAAPESFRHSHLPGALRFADVAQATAVLGTDDRIVVYGADRTCRSAPAWVAELRRRGFQRTVWFEDGIAGWRAAGGQVEGAEGGTGSPDNG